ncbi:MAG: hypothetical protein ACE5G2_12065 [Candidatus Krumholzibacteriia bacterium]
MRSGSLLQIDMTAITQTDPSQTSSTEVGIRQTGAGDFNPGPFNVYQGGAGGSMTSLVGDLGPEAGTEPILDLDDKHNLSASGGRDERDYDVLCADPNAVLAPFGTFTSCGIWFDRDGVDAFQTMHPCSGDGVNYNTGGIYDVVITYHATSATHGTMCATINGFPAGFYSGAFSNDPPDLSPAGLSFTGDMTTMQVFAGLWAMSGAGGDVVLLDITATGCLLEPIAVEERTWSVVKAIYR